MRAERPGASGIVAFAAVFLSVSVSRAGADSWPMQGHDAQRSGRTTAAGPVAPNLKWTYRFTSRAQDHASPIVGQDGVVYVPGEDGLTAFHPGGTVKWTTGYDSRLAPALSPDGATVYVASNIWAEYTLVALDTADGSLRWQWPLPGDWSDTSYSSLAVGPDGTIYFGSRLPPAMNAVKPDGTLRWRAEIASACVTASGVEAPPALGPEGNVYYIQNCDGLVAVDSAGQHLWTVAEVNVAYSWPTPTVGPDGTIYLSKFESDSDAHSEVMALRADGTIKWRAPFADYGARLNGLALSADGTSLYRVLGGRVVALDPQTGATKWEGPPFTLFETTTVPAPALAGNGVLYVRGTSDTTLERNGTSYQLEAVYAVSELDGRKLWQHVFESWGLYFVLQSPAIGPDGTLFVQSSGAAGVFGDFPRDLVAFSPPAAGADPAFSWLRTEPLYSGLRSSYVLRVANAGLSPTSGTVHVENTMPAGLQARGAHAAGWSCETTGTSVACEHPAALAAGVTGLSDITVDVEVSAAAGTTLTNTATLTYAGDAVPENDFRSDTTVVCPATAIAYGETRAGALDASDCRRAERFGPPYGWDFPAERYYFDGRAGDPIRVRTTGNAGVDLFLARPDGTFAAATEPAGDVVQLLEVLPSDGRYAIEVARDSVDPRGGYSLTLSLERPVSCATVDSCGFGLTFSSSSSGESEWFDEAATVYSGPSAAQSGLLTDWGWSTLSTTIGGPATVGFHWSVSCSSNNAYLRLYLDGTQKARISGTVGWTRQTVEIPPGSHTLEWKYAKTGSIISGANAGWIDKVEIVAPAPTITGFSPTSGAPGTAVSVTGTNLAGATIVAFNGTSAAFTAGSPASITATVPLGATTGPISVTTSSGTATSASPFTVTIPTITGLSPTAGPIGTSVSVTGTRLAGATSVRFGGTSAVFAVDAPTSITAAVPAGAASGPVTVTTPEGTATSANAFAVIPPISGALELVHGASAERSLAALAGPVQAEHVYFLEQKPYSSYEVAVDEISGDVQTLPGEPLLVELLAADGTTVQASSAGSTTVGHSRSLRFRNSGAGPIAEQRVRIRSGACTTDCGADDGYRVRAYETTATIPRFNNAGSQITVLLLQNPALDQIAGTASFWAASGTLLGSWPFSLGGNATLVLNTSTVPGASGVSGAITIAHDGPYGSLVGKAVALEPATGFSFDSPMLWRPVR